MHDAEKRMRRVYDHFTFVSQLEEIVKGLKQWRANSSLHAGLYNSFESVDQTANKRCQNNQRYFYV
jgi:hypothetical protein